MLKILKLFFVFIFLCFAGQSYGNFQIVEIYPNTIDDKNLEYISIQNTSSKTLSFSGFTLSDKSKSYIIPSDRMIIGGEKYIFSRLETKLILNNSNEEIFLYDSTGHLIESVSYKNSVKGEPIYFEIEGNGENFIGKNTTTEVSSPLGIITDGGESQSYSGELDIEMKLSEDSKVGDLVFQLQRPSYVSQSGSSHIYICESDRNECKINFNLEINFNNLLKKSDHVCRINFGGVGEAESEKCNPNTVIFPEGKTEVIFQIFSKTTQELVMQKNIDVMFDRSLKAQETKTISKMQDTPKLALLKPKIIIQSGLSGQGTNFFCKKQPCSINLEYKKIHSDVGCFWDFGPGVARSDTTRERCNPGYVDIPEGRFILALRVYEKDYPLNSKTTKFYIHNIPEEVITQEDIIPEISGISDEYISDTIHLNFYENIKQKDIVLSGSILVQGNIGKNKILSGTLLECEDVERCYVNFDTNITSIDRDLSYKWTDNKVIFSESQNPKGVWFERGKREIKLQVYAGELFIGERNFVIDVKGGKQRILSIQQEDTNLNTEPILFFDTKEIVKVIKKVPGFTQNFLPLKYDGLRISGMAPTGAKIEIFNNGEKILSGAPDEKGKYRLVSKDFLAGEYSFDTRIVLESGEEIYLEKSGEYMLTGEKRANWFIPKKTSIKKKSSTISSTSKVSPKLVVKESDIFISEEIETLSLREKILFIAGLLFLAICMLLHMISKTSKLAFKDSFSVYVEQYSVKHKITLILP